MKVKFLVVGKTAFDYLKVGEEIYQDRLKHYCSFERIEVQDVKNPKNFSKEEIKRKEAIAILSKLSPNDFLILLDENGKEFSSVELANWIEKRNLLPQNIVFVIGGAYGFDSSIYERMNMKLALSKMTFSHQMVRIIFLEQLYRAYTITKGEPYHHE
ncbi:MAG: 23S rRNA (pseudouridine(1915)-N(3))-methyltransferase RlmH [Bacteroidetes bacterium]|nr:23S rRNA (pseudouridine(1915)-N(3))-methyltransferase RlmH [Bacteroidota bacterium]